MCNNGATHTTAVHKNASVTYPKSYNTSQPALDPSIRVEMRHFGHVINGITRNDCCYIVLYHCYCASTMMMIVIVAAECY